MSDPNPAPSPAPDPAPSPAPDPSPSSPGIFSEGLAFSEGWYEQVKDSAFDPYRSMAAQFKDLPTVFKSLHDTKAALSQRTEGMVKLPGKDAPAEEVAAFHRALGVPETVDAYQVELPAQLPEGIEISADQLGRFREFAHSAGIPPETASKLIAFQIAAESEAVAAIQAEANQARQEAEETIKREWGPKYEQNLMLARRAAETFGLGADHPAMKNPDVLRAMASAAAKISETSLVSGEKLAGTLSPGSEAKDILANPDNPLHKAYHDSSHPQHEAAVRTYTEKLKEQVRREGHQV